MNMEDTTHHKLLLEDLLFILNRHITDFPITLEVLMILSLLSGNEDDSFKSCIESSQKFISTLQLVIEQYNDHEENKKAISQAIAHLPIEELNKIL